MLIFRYLTKEVFTTVVALTVILLLIFMSNQLVQYISRAASGSIPGMIIIKLMMLEMPNLLGLLLPLGFYISLLVAYGRLYAENEMTVLQACGYSPLHLLKHSFIMAAVVALIVMVITLWLSPMVAVERAKLLRTSGIQTLIKTLVPGRFRQIADGQVFYIESMNRDHTKAENVFLARKTSNKNLATWQVLWAKRVFAETNTKNLEDYIIFQQGKGYEGFPGRADYQVAEFDEYKIRLPHPSVSVKQDIRTLKTTELFRLSHSDCRKAAEFQWRLSVPIMVFTLTLLAVPLSRVNPRSGKYAKLLPAILIYIIYANFIFICRDWIIVGKIPVWIGIWWLHLAMAIIGLFFIWRNRRIMA